MQSDFAGRQRKKEHLSFVRDQNRDYLPVITAQLQSREEGVDPEQQRCVNRGR